MKKSLSVTNAIMDFPRALKELPENRLLRLYTDEVLPALAKNFSLHHHHVPSIERVTISTIPGEDPNSLLVALGAVMWGEKVENLLQEIDKASWVPMKDKTASPMYHVTFMANHMYHFLDRFVNCLLPTLTDFKGFPSSYFVCPNTFSFQAQLWVEELGNIYLNVGITMKPAASFEVCHKLLTSLGLPIK